MNRLRAIPVVAMLCASTALFVTRAEAAAPIPIKVTYQPALYWALPFYVATEKGWWAAAGLAPEFVVFPAGVPQMAAAAAKSWDVGGTGSVPAVLGYKRFGVEVIGITNDESQGNVLMASKARYEAVKSNPASLKGQTIVLTSNSTGDYAVQACLKKYGLAKSDVTLRNMGQAEIISAMSSGNADYAGVWAPYDYTLEEKSGARVLCSGKDGGASVPGALVARGDYAREHPEAVAAFLAVYLRAWSWMKANPDQAVALMKKFYQDGGVAISDASMQKEFATRPTFDLTQQLAAMDRSKGPSEADKWFTSIAQFMRASGALAAVPEAKDYIDDSLMKRVQADPKLAAFAKDNR